MSQEFEEQLIRSRYSQSKGDKTIAPGPSDTYRRLVLRKVTIHQAEKIQLAVPPLRAPAFFASISDIS